MEYKAQKWNLNICLKDDQVKTWRNGPKWLVKCFLLKKWPKRLYMAEPNLGEYSCVTYKTLTIPILCFIFRDVRILMLIIRKNRKKGYNINQNDPILYIWRNGDGFIALKSPKNWKYGHFGPFFQVFSKWSFRRMSYWPTRIYGIHFDAFYSEVFRF